MSEWTDVVDAHDREVKRVASALCEVLENQRGKAAAWSHVRDLTVDENILKPLCEEAAAAALGIIAETPGKPHGGRISQHVREEARRLSRKQDEALLTEWGRMQVRVEDIVVTTLLSDVRCTAWRLGIDLEGRASQSKYTADLRTTLCTVATGKVNLDAPPGAMSIRSKAGRPPDLQSELAAELIVRLYVQVTGRQPSVNHGEAGRRSIQRFAEDVCLPLRLTEPGRRILDAAIRTARVNADGRAMRQAASEAAATGAVKSAIMRLVRH